MEIMPLTRADSANLQQLLTQGTQVFPFFSTHSEAIRKMRQNLRKEECWGFFEGRNLLGVASVTADSHEMRVTNYLWLNKLDNPLNSVTNWQNQLKKLAKKKRVKKMSYQLLMTNNFIVQSLKKQGAEVEVHGGNGRFSYELIYRTAFVLAGGGARGAFQIGAWQALRELGIEESLICGTSVGALNGALIRQGDLDSARRMWEEIDTGKILAYPNQQETQEVSLTSLLKEIQNFATSAISTLGVSTEPLERLIEELLDEEKLFSKEKELYLVTTQIPAMKETVISIKETNPLEFPKWLLASSSFFPAMQATKIGDNYYVDGGYRNNIPVDVALEAGATELVIIDVKGPGVSKMIKIPDEIPVWTIKSPWPLGNVLLFDGGRSQWNIQLGYIETMKTFGYYQGYWYGLDPKNLKQERRLLNSWLMSGLDQNLEFKSKILTEDGLLTNEIVKKIRKLYKGPVNTETIGQIILELCAKLLEITPTNCYTIWSLVSSLSGKIEVLRNVTVENDEQGLLSLSEWGKKYLDHSPLFITEFQQVAYLYKRLKQPSQLTDNILANLLREASPVSCLMALLLVEIGKQDLAQTQERK